MELRHDERDAAVVRVHAVWHISSMTLRGPAAAAAFTFVFTGIFARAEVVDSSAGGFTVKTTLTVNDTPAVVYDRLVRKIGDWWNPVHTYTHDAHNLSIQDKAMGCFCETLPDGGAVRHMEVINVAPNKWLVMSGALGPMQPMALTGTMQIRLTPAEGGTKLEVTYAVGGYMVGGLTPLASPVDGVIVDQFTRMKNYVEHGSPTPK